MNITIKNARVIDPRHQIDRVADIFISDGRIIAPAPANFNAEQEIDASGLVACPGLIDLCARPGDLATDLAAAVAGGVTTLVCPPNLNPVLDEPERVERLTKQAESLRLARLLPLGALTRNLAGERLSELVILAKAGCVAFSQGQSPIIDTEALLRAFEYAATFNFPLWIRPQDYFLSRNGFAHNGAISGRLGLTGIPVSAETVALATLLTLATDTGVRLHLCCLSSAAGMAMVARAKADGLPVSCHVGAHHLHLSESAIGFFDTAARLDPPLRSEADRLALREGVRAGHAAICSDHTPLTQDDKLLPFGSAKPGATGLELLLPLTLRWGMEMGLSLPEILAPLTSLPATILGRDDLGHLGAGACADICLFAPEASWQVLPENLKSFSKHTPFAGQTVVGQVKKTLVGGEVVFAA
ncbi:MAG: dihydroorotase [Betaproteobacteria bacterium]|nr:dihydroorotase [Betaproteobacteria bacterium]